MRDDKFMRIAMVFIIVLYTLYAIKIFCKPKLKQQPAIILQYNDEEVQQLLKDEYSRGFNDGLEFSAKLYDRDIEIEQFKIKNRR